MRAPKIIVVGAGPSGASCALAILQRMPRAELLLLDKSSYPRVKVCGSGLSPHALNQLERLGIKQALARETRASITSLRTIGPGGGELVIRSGQEAWVYPRVEFDHRLVREAVARGAEFSEGTKVTELLRDDPGPGEARGTVRGVQTRSGALEADLVICADGSPSRFSIDARPRTTIQTIMAWYRGAGFTPERAWMVWDRALAGYYFWVFPEPGGVFNVGLTIPEDAPDVRRLKPLFRELCDQYCARELAGAEQLGRLRGHPAVVTNSLGPLSEPRALWVGEAARLVMPGSVEGIGFALASGLRGADLVHEHFSPYHGFSALARRRHQLATAREVLPKFWAGHAFVQAVRSPVVRPLGRALSSRRIKPLVDQALLKLLGQEQRAAS